MTLYEFNVLTFEEKQAIVWDKGVFLDKYVTEDICINCYEIDNFFVEVVYNAKWTTITDVRTIKYGHILDKYSNI
jgi:hypothetical protein